jgi:hypothetical protein
VGGGIKEKPHDSTANSEGVKFMLSFKTLTPLFTMQAVRDRSLLSLLFSSSATLLLGRRLPTFFLLLRGLTAKGEIASGRVVVTNRLFDTLVTETNLACFLFFAEFAGVVGFGPTGWRNLQSAREHSPF